VSDGVRCTICGRPNVGKSSLFNCITGEDSAIVTDIAGTTRDILRETVSFGGVTLRLSDTAGIHEADETVEQIGIDRAEREVRDAELILAVFDGSVPLTGEDRRLIALLETAAAPVICVINKSDRGEALTEADWTELQKINQTPVRISAGSDTVDPEENGMAALSRAVADLFGSGAVDLANDAVIWDVRQRELLLRAEKALAGAAEGLDGGDPLDCVCTLVEEGMAALNETDGRGIDETIVAEIFKRFCVGK
jgi:tRNA modification GTPase